MKIHITDCPRRYPHHFANLIVDAFRSLGHEAISFDTSEYPTFYLTLDRAIRKSPLYFFTKRKNDFVDFKSRYRALVSAHWLRTIRDAKPDVVLLINNAWITREAIITAKESLHIKKIICWVVDDPSRTAAEDLVSLLPYCDLVFIIDPGWIPFTQFFNERTIYLPLAASDAYYRPAEVAPAWDISYVGSFFKGDPAGFFRASILSHLPADCRVKIVGPGLRYFTHVYPALNRFDWSDELWGVTDVNRLYCASKMTISLYQPQVLEGVSPRIFEIALSKTFQVIQDTATVYDLFPGITLPTFKSIKEFTKKTDYYLSHPRERQELTEAMFHIAKEKHLFVHRISTLIDFL